MSGSLGQFFVLDEFIDGSFCIFRGSLSNLSFSQIHEEKKVSKPNEYVCNEKVVSFLEQAKLSLAALRLTYACCHYLDQRRGLSLAGMSLKNAKTCTVRTLVLVRTTGSPGANDNDMIAEGMEDLAIPRDRKIFEVLKLSENGRRLEFKFATGFASCGLMHKKDKFAMVDTSILAMLRSPAQVFFYSRAVMVHRSDQPQFYLPVIGSNARPWSDQRRNWMRAAERVGALLGQDYLFLPELDPHDDSVVAVKVKVSTSTSKWSPGKLYPRHSLGSVSAVVGGKGKSLKNDDLFLRNLWTRVAGP